METRDATTAESMTVILAGAICAACGTRECAANAVNVLVPPRRFRGSRYDLGPESKAPARLVGSRAGVLCVSRMYPHGDCGRDDDFVIPDFGNFKCLDYAKSSSPPFTRPPNSASHTAANAQCL